MNQAKQVNDQTNASSVLTEGSEVENLVHERFAEILTRNTPQNCNDEPIKTILAELSKSATKGNSCFNLEKEQEDAISDWLDCLPDNKGASAAVSLRGSKLYLNKYSQAEKSIEEKLKNFPLTNEVNSDEKGILEILNNHKHLKGKDNTDEQVTAIKDSINRNLSIISGGPGTGKTTIVVSLLAVLLSENTTLNVEILAPTGKASARLKESIIKGLKDYDDNLAPEIKTKIKEMALNAKTVQKFLAINPNTRESRFSKGGKANIDIIIVDEASMLDLILMEQLLSAINTKKTRLILLGDPYQLASVEAGNVLAQIVEQSQVNKELNNCCSMLTTSHRFNNESAIGALAKCINNGNNSTVSGGPVLNCINDLECIDKLDGTYFIENIEESINEQNILGIASKFYKEFKEEIKSNKGFPLCDKNKKTIFEAFNKSQVFTPFRSGRLGGSGLNNHIELTLKLIESKQSSSNEFYFGKPIIITQNDHSLKLNNGDIGICLDKDGKNVSFPYMNNEGQETYREINTRILPEHQLVYAMTVHKSQGSEYDHCLLIVPEPNENQKQLLTRETFYTAVTRAKKSITIAATKKNIDIMIDSPTKRDSGLFVTEENSN